MGRDAGDLLRGPRKRRRWSLAASNVQSLAEVKWDVAKAMLVQLRSNVLILSEMWFQNTIVNLDLPGYHTIQGCAAGCGKMIVMWIRQVLGEQHKKVRDARHSLLCTGVTGNTWSGGGGCTCLNVRRQHNMPMRRGR